MLTALWSAPQDLWPRWQAAIEHELSGIARVVHEAPDPTAIDALIHAPNPDFTDFAPYQQAGLVQSLWAGVEHIISNRSLTQPLARMVDPSLREAMVEYCLGWAMRQHLGMDRHKQDGIWRPDATPPLARDRRVTVLGTGALGGAVAQCLAKLGFDVTGWSPSGRAVEGVHVLAGADGLDTALRRAEILITLLPDTPQTHDLLDSRSLALLPPGAAIINPGRGTVIDDAALIAALDSGHLDHAVLDVFRTEPLPPEHIFWAHPKVTVTPHVAAETRPHSAAKTVAENLRRLRDGRPLLYLVDRQRGY